jgi:phosphomannomutase
VKEFLKVGISGVRGVVGETFTPQLAASFARAFGVAVGRGGVLIGRDTRPSGPLVERAVVAGLQSAGCQPLLAGVVATPTLAMLVRDLGARGAIAITASHNPAPWNALKFIGRDGLFLGRARAEELFDIYHQGQFDLVPEAALPAAEPVADPMAGHVRRVLEYVDAAAIRQRRFRVALDPVNGVGALHTRAFLDELGCETVACHDAPSGLFEREAEPLPENLGALGALVRKHGCDVGFAQDPDGDRLALVDEQGRPIGEDLTLAFGVQAVLDRHARGPVAIHLATSRAVQDVAERRGSAVTRTRIGEINVTEAMLALGAPVGGEGNGGVIVPAVHPGRDSYIAMALVLELLVKERCTVSQARDAVPRYALLKKKLPMRPKHVPDALRRLRRHYAGRRVNLLDGVFVDYPDAWVHVRPSNTEPILRLVAEAPTAEAATRLLDEARVVLAPTADSPRPLVGGRADGQG